MKSSFNMGLHKLARLSAKTVLNNPKQLEKAGAFIDESGMTLNRKQRRRMDKRLSKSQKGVTP